MTRRVGVASLILALVCAMLIRETRVRSEAVAGPREYVYTGTVTTAGMSLNFGFNAMSILLTNDGDTDVFFTLSGAGPSAEGFPLKPGEVFNIRVEAIRLGMTTASGSSTVRVGAWR